MATRRSKGKKVKPHTAARRGQKCPRCGKVHSRSAHWSHAKNRASKWFGRTKRPQTARARRSGGGALKSTRKKLRATRRRATEARMAIGELAFQSAARRGTRKVARKSGAMRGTSKSFARAVAAGRPKKFMKVKRSAKKRQEVGGIIPRLPSL